MRCGERAVGLVLLGFVGALGSGCASLDEHLKLKQAHRLLEAEKQQAAQELFDERQANDNLRTKIDSLERERSSREQLIASLQQENERLDEIRKSATGALEGMASRTLLSPISINSPAILPAPLDSAIKQFAEAHPNQVVYDPATGSVKWNADLLFDLGSADVKTTSADALKGFTDILRSAAAADFEVFVVGHTDNVRIAKPGTKEKHPTNWHLSAHRAISVSNELQKFGYQATRLSVAGCAEYRPVADNASESGKQMNRRVEIYLKPAGSVVPGSVKVAASAPAPKSQPAKSPKPAVQPNAASASGSTEP